MESVTYARPEWMTEEMAAAANAAWAAHAAEEAEDVRLREAKALARFARLGGDLTDVVAESDRYSVHVFHRPPGRRKPRRLGEVRMRVDHRRAGLAKFTIRREWWRRGALP